jgi:hypothetical protein
MIPAKLDLPFYSIGATYRQRITWTSTVPIFSLMIDNFTFRIVTQVPHNLVDGTLVSLQNVFPVFYNVENTPVTVVDNYTFTIVPGVPLPNYIASPPSFLETSLRVPVNLTGSTPSLSFVQTTPVGVSTLPVTTSLTVTPLEGIIDILIEDESTALLPDPSIDPVISYKLDVAHTNGEVTRLLVGEFTKLCFQKGDSHVLCNVSNPIVVVSAPQGPPGVQGQAGATGNSGAVPILQQQLIATADGEQIITIISPTPLIPLLWTDVYINGLLQPRSSYTITNFTVDLPLTLNIMTNDVIDINFQ